MNGPEYGKEVIIEEDVWIAGNAIILPGVRIGRGAIIGAGSVVTKSVPPLWTVVGNPARLLRKVKTELKAEESLSEAPSQVMKDKEEMATIMVENREVLEK
jgi:acetyltransferase-like isoleucine patch superfamily enzyme